MTGREGITIGNVLIIRRLKMHSGYTDIQDFIIVEQLAITIVVGQE